MTRAGAPFGIVFLPESLGDFGRLCREAEEAGFDLPGEADSQSVFRELNVALAVAAGFQKVGTLSVDHTGPSRSLSGSDTTTLPPRGSGSPRSGPAQVVYIQQST